MEVAGLKLDKKWPYNTRYNFAFSWWWEDSIYTIPGSQLSAVIFFQSVTPKYLLFPARARAKVLILPRRKWIPSVPSRPRSGHLNEWDMAILTRPLPSPNSCRLSVAVLIPSLGTVCRSKFDPLSGYFFWLISGKNWFLAFFFRHSKVCFWEPWN